VCPTGNPFKIQSALFINYNDVSLALRQNEVYYTFYYAYLYTIVMAAGPVLLLIILNTAIVVIMRQSCNEANQSGSNQSGSDITTFVLVVCLFISCNILVSFYIC
jgi:hypothetical protein